MHKTTNLLDQLAFVYGQSMIHPFLTPSTVAREPSGGYVLPEADAYARRQAEAAETFLRFARERSRMQDQTLVRKALHALAFSLRHRCNGFCVPSKLSGTAQRARQRALWQLTRVPFGTQLDVDEVKDGKCVRLVVSLRGDELGEVQSKWVPVLRPLLAFHAEVRLVRVTGLEHEGYRLGLNCCFAHLDRSISVLKRALGSDLDAEFGGDGYGGDGAAERPVEPGAASLDTASTQRGDGAAGDAPVAPTSADNEIRFWRDEDGVLRMNVRGVIRHSPTGPEIGYAGSGPADAALSVLSAVTSREEAERCYQLFKHEVISRLDPNGATLTRASVRAWLDRQTGERLDGHSA